MNRVVGALAVLAAVVACSRDQDTSQSTRTLAPTVTTTRTVREAPASARALTPAEQTPPGVSLVQPAAAQGAAVSPAAVSPAAVAPAAVSTPNAAAPSKGTSAIVGKAKLALRGCRLEVTWTGGATTTKEVELPEPCSFVTTRTGAQVVKTDHGQTLLVVSSRRDESTEKDCDTKVRAVVVQGDRVGISREKQEIAMCGSDGPFDTILFHTLAASAF